jgi:hypothetical protein
MVKFSRLILPQFREICRKNENRDEKATTKHEQNASKSAWWGVIRVCGLTMILARATASNSAPLAKFPMKSQWDSKTLAPARALTPRKGAMGDNYTIEEKGDKR